MHIEVHHNGSATLTISKPGTDAQTGVGIAPPWAIDADGDAVPAWYEADGSKLIQVVDSREATMPVTFDPTYITMNYVGHWSDQNAWVYVNTTTSDQAYCPVLGMLDAVRRYKPVFGFEANVYNDYGYIALRQSGDCTIIPDTGGSYDFQVPCKAHDYCYDLRVAGFSGTVSDGDCDRSFYWLMEAHCNDRAFPLNVDCRLMRDAAYLAVSAPGVVTDPSPGLVEIKNVASGRCADVEGPSIANNTPFQQWQCVGVHNQHFRIHPAPGSPGEFQIKAEHSGKCARAFTTVYQYDCVDTWNSERFRVQGAMNQDKYSLRGGSSSYASCWKVPVSYTNGVDLTHPSCDDYNNWYIWRIVRAH